MSYLFAVVAFILFGLINIFDKFILEKASIKLTFVIKSFMFVLFTLIMLGAKDDFANGKFTDFKELEWLYLFILAVLIIVSFVFYHFAIKKNNGFKNAVVNTSSFLIFVNLFFMSFMMKEYLVNIDVLHIIFLVIQIASVFACLALTLFVYSKEDNKIGFLYSGVSTLALAGFLIIKETLLKRQTMEVVFFYAAIIAFVVSLIVFILDKKELNSLKANHWSNFVILAIIPFGVGFYYLLGYKGLEEVDVNVQAINMVIGFTFLVFVGIEIYHAIKEKKSFKQMTYFIVPSALLLLSLVSYMIATGK